MSTKQTIPIAYRLMAVCRNLPAHTANEFRDTIFTEQVMTQGEMQGFLRPYSAGLGWRLSPRGYALLREHGFDYEGDHHTQRVGRRFYHAAVASTMLAAAVSPFLSSLAELRGTEVGYLPAMSLRARAGQNVLGSSQVMGLLRLRAKLYAVYWPVAGEHILVPEREYDRLSGLALGAGCQSLGMIFCGDSCSAVWQVLTEPCDCSRKSRREKRSYSALYRLAPCDCLLLPATRTGAEQLRVMSVPDYPQKLNRIFQLSGNIVPLCHAHRTAVNLPVRYGVDLNLKEGAQAARNARAAGYDRLLLCALRGQDLFLRHVLRAEGCEISLLTPAALDRLFREARP